MVHLPIGVLIFAFLQLTYNKFASPKVSVSFNLSFALLVIFASTLLSALTGYERASSGGFQGDTLDLHKYMGFILCGVTFTLWFCYNKYKGSKMYYTLFCGAILLLSYVGHLGGTLTHGVGFLTSLNDSENIKLTIDDPLTANVFNDIILPIINNKCISCHNENKSNGDLLLRTKDNWEMGGKSGTLLDKYNKSNSLISVRMHLPFDSKEHMPPPGKKQLTVDEFRILDWWIQNMNNYEETLESIKPTDAILKAIDNLYGKNDLVQYSLDHLALLDKYGIKYHQLDSNYKELAIDFTNTKVSRKLLKLLEPLNSNIIELDMSFSSLNSNVLRALKNFRNLRKLELDNTNVTSKDLIFLKDINSLETLNLYNTRVNDDTKETLSTLINLKQIYLWQTDFSVESINELTKSNRQLIVDSGVKNEFSGAQLLSPIIDVESFVFSDSTEIRLTALPANSNIFYAFNSDTLGANALIYEKPIILHNPTELILQSRLEGWVSSDYKKTTFLKSRIKPASVRLEEKPNEKYYGQAEESLFDLTKGSEIFSDGQWLGFQEEHCTVDITLEKNESLSSISVGSLSDFGSYIFLPRGIRVEVSLDGNVYTEIVNRVYDEMEAPSAKVIKNFLIPFTAVNAKYIRIKVLSQLRNPKWHPAPSAPSWLFIDEITLY